MASIRSGIGENMEDRYLFKAKRLDNGEWAQGCLFDDGFENGRIFIGGLVIEKYNGTACDEWNVTGIDFYEVDPSTICQCTGLKDKNGKLIWDNDIMVGHLDKTYPDDKTYQKVIWKESGFYSKIKGSEDIEPIDRFDQEWFEVIGNIFDNAELLESEE